jgi:cytochrome c553
MRHPASQILAIGALLLMASLVGAADEVPPPWAFPVNPPGLKPAPDDGRPRQVPGSDATFTLTQIRDLYNVPDWHPDTHPPMPGMVGHGPREGAFACAFCHLPNGLGRPENASLAGLPEDYIIRQVADFRSGARKSSETRNLPGALMVGVAQSASEAEVRVAAQYFAALKPQPWLRVIETDTVPRTHVAGWMLVADEPAATEPIGRRIIEVPENLERTELRDSSSGFIAYVPKGSVDRGRQLVDNASGKPQRCTICHGADLKGLGPIPALAGRSPSYLVRQLYDLQHGTRRGPWSPLMLSVVADLSEDDMIAIAAYAASLPP